MKHRLLSIVIGGGSGLVVWLAINVASTRLLAIVALVTVLVLLVILAGVALGLARFWLQVAPQVTPVLSMFAPPAVGAEPAGGADSGRVVAPPADLRNGWPVTCDTCRGVGLIGGHGDQRSCPDCKGTGLPPAA